MSQFASTPHLPLDPTQEATKMDPSALMESLQALPDSQLNTLHNLLQGQAAHVDSPSQNAELLMNSDSLQSYGGDTPTSSQTVSAMLGNPDETGPLPMMGVLIECSDSVSRANSSFHKRSQKQSQQSARDKENIATHISGTRRSTTAELLRPQSFEDTTPEEASNDKFSAASLPETLPSKAASEDEKEEEEEEDNAAQHNNNNSVSNTQQATQVLPMSALQSQAIESQRRSQPLTQTQVIEPQSNNFLTQTQKLATQQQSQTQTQKVATQLSQSQTQTQKVATQPSQSQQQTQLVQSLPQTQSQAEISPVNRVVSPRMQTSSTFQFGRNGDGTAKDGGKQDEEEEEAGRDDDTYAFFASQIDPDLQDLPPTENAPAQTVPRARDAPMSARELKIDQFTQDFKNTYLAENSKMSQELIESTARHLAEMKMQREEALRRESDVFREHRAQHGIPSPPQTPPKHKSNAQQQQKQQPRQQSPALRQTQSPSPSPERKMDTQLDSSQEEEEEEAEEEQQQQQQQRKRNAVSHNKKKKEKKNNEQKKTKKAPIAKGVLPVKGAAVLNFTNMDLNNVISGKRTRKTVIGSLAVGNKRKQPESSSSKKPTPVSNKKVKTANGSGAKRGGSKQKKMDVDSESSDSSSDSSSSSSDDDEEGEEEDDVDNTQDAEDVTEEWNDKLGLPKAPDAPRWADVDASFVVPGKRTRRPSAIAVSQASLTTKTRTTNNNTEKKKPVAKPKQKTPPPQQRKHVTTTRVPASSSSSSSSSASSSLSSLSALSTPNTSMVRNIMHMSPARPLQHPSPELGLDRNAWFIGNMRGTPVSPPPQQQVVPGEFCLEPEFVVDHRIRVHGQPPMGVLECRVRWKGFSDYEDTWVPAHTMLQWPCYVEYAKEKNFASRFTAARAITTSASASSSSTTRKAVAKPPVPVFSSASSSSSSSASSRRRSGGMDIDGDSMMMPASQDVVTGLPVSTTEPEEIVIFRGIRFMLTGFATRASDNKQAEMTTRFIQKYGGVILKEPMDALDYVRENNNTDRRLMIVSGGTTRTGKAFMARGFDIPLVKPRFLKDCIASGHVISWEPAEDVNARIREQERYFIQLGAEEAWTTVCDPAPIKERKCYGKTFLIVGSLQSLMQYHCILGAAGGIVYDMDGRCTPLGRRTKEHGDKDKWKTLLKSKKFDFVVLVDSDYEPTKKQIKQFNKYCPMKTKKNNNKKKVRDVVIVTTDYMTDSLLDVSGEFLKPSGNPIYKCDPFI